MHQGKRVFSQRMAHMPPSTLRRCVAAHRGEHKVKDFSCLGQFFAECAQHLIGMARPLYADEPLGVDLDATGCAFDATNFALKPEKIADLYRQRWQVELVFQWIQQHLRIKALLGTSGNAVKTQIWIAVCTYVRIATVKNRLHLPHSLYEILQILQILGLSLFETTPINQLLTHPLTDPGASSVPQQLPLL